MGVDPLIWGPTLWKYLHSIAINYPDIPDKTWKIKYYNFVWTLCETIPCDMCRNHFRKFLVMGSKTVKKFSYEILVDRRTFFKWTYDVHNFVNSQIPNKKKTKQLSYNEVVKMYNNILTTDTKLII